MIQPFCSVYTKSYRNHGKDPEPEDTKPCLFYNDLVENFLPAQDSKDIYNQERDETVIKDLYLKSLISTYQHSYCSSEGKKSMVIDPNNLEEDQFMVHFNKYYKTKTQALLKPVDTARMINGYCRFSNYYTGKTEYESSIGREGYNYFKKDYDKGKSRLYAKKQAAVNKGKEPEKKEEKQGDKKQEKKETATQDLDKLEAKSCEDKICVIYCE